YLPPCMYPIAFKPVRLDCSHMFCICFAVKLERQLTDRCPLCRQPKFLIKADGILFSGLLYFPKETKRNKSRIIRNLHSKNFHT
ncbi:hypothetical protein V1527DRAFT_415906, partial [Lipomyces starkeyi]